ncbi:WecB/TagA/CpsF family glycosyltransferase [Microbulbifer pacificus]|uniref:WecB/TagA/CpsF family glycosyltransferase n=1 Tax=Microbulbifer pacificus TaxID=407164 RepID=UPI00131A1EE9|nr:WecB/TagA/CpsF family glycosyltransferase [Microbulbifer pacificus]
MIDLSGLPLSTEFSVSEVFDCFAQSKNSFTCTFINPHSFYLAKNNSAYVEALKKFDYVLADGIGVVSYAKKVGADSVSRFSFDNTSLAPKVFETCRKMGLKIGVVGGVAGVSDRFAELIGNEFSGLDIISICHGYFTDDEILKFVVDANVDVLLLGLGAPRQELLACKIKALPGKTLLFTCGGFLDQRILSKAYYPKIIDKFNLRFLYRLVKEPRRLWRRYLIEYRVFAFLWVKAVAHANKHS